MNALDESFFQVEWKNNLQFTFFGGNFVQELESAVNFYQSPVLGR